MKVGPKTDYPVKVIHEPWEQEPPTDELYRGVFTANLNYLVHVAFVPDVSAVAPPWDDHLLPADLDEITTPEQARLATAIFDSYVVTPNEARAGEVERFEWGHDEEYGPWRGVVFYLSTGEFERYGGELARLAEMNEDSFYAKQTVSALGGYEVIDFLRRRVLTSPWLLPNDAVMLGLTQGRAPS